MPESNQGRNLLFSSFFVLEVEKEKYFVLLFVVGFFVIQLVASTTCPVRLWRLTIRRDWWQSAAMAQVATVLLLHPCPYRRLQQQWETSTTFRSRPLACQIKVTTAVAATICRIDPAASRSSRPAAAVPTALRPFPTLIDPSAQSRSRCPAPWVAFLAAPAAPASSISSNNRSNSMTSQRPTIR